MTEGRVSRQAVSSTLYNLSDFVDANSNTCPTAAPCTHGHNLVYRFATLAPSSSFRFLVNPFGRQQGQGVGGPVSAAMLFVTVTWAGIRTCFCVQLELRRVKRDAKT
jgi:hypothetical protein